VLNTITTGTTTTIGTTTTEVMNMNTTMTDAVITTTTIDSTRRCNCSVALTEPVLRFQDAGWSSPSAAEATPTLFLKGMAKSVP